MAWETPRVASDLPGFVSSLLGATGEQERFILLPRGGAPWLTGTEYDQGPLVEQLRDRIVATLSVPPGFDGALSFSKSEWRDIMLVVLTFLVYGWCTSDDLHLLPGDLSLILLTSHHGSVRVAGRSPEKIDTFTRAMARGRFYPAGSADEDAAV